MESKLQIFNNEDLGEVQVGLLNNQIVLNLFDVCFNLGYTKESKGKKYLRKDLIENICDNLDITGLSVGDNQIKIVKDIDFKNTYIIEEDFYDLCLESKVKNARKFRKWVTAEILPTIRKTGGYVANSDLMVNTYFGALDDTHKELVKGLFKNIEAQQNQINILNKENDALSKDVLSWADESIINALVRKYGANTGKFGEAWITFKKELLYKYSINLNSRITNYLNTSNRKTKPKTLSMLRGREELTMALKTVVAMCREENIDISDLLGKHNNEV